MPFLLPFPFINLIDTMLGRRRSKRDVARDWRGKQNAKDIKSWKEKENTITQNDRNRRERRPFECD